VAQSLVALVPLAAMLMEVEAMLPPLAERVAAMVALVALAESE
jgi:hypothetical protein